MNNLTSLLDLSMNFAGEVIKQQTRVGLLKATSDIGNMNADFLSRMANPFGDDPITPDNYKDKLAEHQDSVNSYLDSMTFKPAQAAARDAVAASEQDLQVRLSATMAKSMGDKLLGDTLGLYSQIQDDPDPAARYQKTKALLNDPSVVAVMPPGVRGSYIAANERGQLVNATASGLLQLHGGDASAASAAVPGLTNKSIAPDIATDVTAILNGQYQLTYAATMKPVAESMADPNFQWRDLAVDRNIDYVNSTPLSDTDKMTNNNVILGKGQQFFLEDLQRQLNLNEGSLTALKGIRAGLDLPNRWWDMPKGEDERKRLIAAADARIASFSPDKTEAKAAQTNVYKSVIFDLQAAVTRPADPMYQNTQGAMDRIISIVNESAHGINAGGFSIDMTGEGAAAIAKLSDMPDQVKTYLTNVRPMLLQAYGLKPNDSLDAKGTSEMLWIINTATSMGKQGNKTPEEVTKWMERVYKDMSSRALKTYRDSKLAGEDMVSAVATMQAGGLANMITVAAGKQVVDPAIQANVDKARAFMLESFADVPGFTKVTPVLKDDGTLEIKAYQKGNDFPTRFRWIGDPADSRQMVLQNLVSSKAGTVWVGKKDAKNNPIVVSAWRKAPNPEADELKVAEFYGKVLSDDPEALASKLADLVQSGQLSTESLNSVPELDPMTRGVDGSVFELFQAEMRKRGLE